VVKSYTKKLTKSHFVSLIRRATTNLFSLYYSKFLIVGILLLIVGTVNIYAIDYYQLQTGNWNNPNTWTTSNSNPSTVINTGTYPQAGDNVHLYNNGSLATITLTADASCANLYFDGSEPACVIAMGNYNLTVTGSWTTNWGSTTTITQGTGYLQVNGGIPQFNIEKTIANFRVGSSSFNFVQTNSVTLTVTSNYDFYCYQQVIPTGISAGSATKHNVTPCSPSLSASVLPGFGTVCTSSSINPNSFTISALALTNANVTVGALNGFSYSTTEGGTYTNTLSIPQNGGNYSQAIYVKFSPISTPTTTSYDGNIVVGGGGASNINVPVTGSGANSVTPTITSPTSSNVLATTATLGATITIAGCPLENVTERGVYYSTTNGFADGTGTKVSETGSFGAGTFTMNVAGLTTSTTYYYKAFATNDIGTVYTSQGTFNNTPTTYYTRQSGNWTSTSTWSTTGCGGTINTGTYPHSGDNVFICQQYFITVNTTGLSCYNLDMSGYACQLILNNDFTINGNLLLTNQSYISAGTHNLTINGNFANTPNEYFSRIEYSSGNITIAGNITAAKGGYEPFTCSGTGWLILSGTSRTFTANYDMSVPRFKQPFTGFTKAGGGTITITNIFDQNFGPTVPSGVIISNPGNTINNTPIKYFRSLANGNWNDISTWQQSTNGGVTWVSATTTPTITDGSVSIQTGHTVTLTANAGVSSITINGLLNVSTFVLSGTGSLSIASTGTLSVGGVTNFPTGFSNSLSIGSTVNYYKAGDQTVLPQTYSNLTLSGSGIKTTASITVNGIFSMEGTATASAAPSFGATTTLQYQGTNSRTTGVEFPNDFSGIGGLIINQGAGNVVTLNANKTALAEINIHSGTFDLSTYTANRASTGGSFIITGTLNLGGTTGGQTGSNFPTNFSTLTLTGGTVNYNNPAGGQTIYSAPAYSILVLSNTSGTQTINSNLSAGTLTINSGASLNVNAAKQLTITTALTNNGTLNLLSDATGTATILTPTSISGSGSVSVQQYLNAARNWYMSSPVTGVNAPTGLTYYRYNEPNNTWPTVSAGTALNLMSGYIAAASVANTITFTGASLNTGTISKSDLSRTTNATKAGFNLVGNPYPSYLNWTSAVANSTNLETSMWYRTKNQSEIYVFDTFNNGIGTNNNGNGVVTQYIPPMQAFWVRVASGKTTGTLDLNNSMRSHASGSNLLKAPSMNNETVQLLRLQISNGINSDEAILVTNPNASDDFDRYDSEKMFNNNAAIPEIYLKADTNKLVIDGMNAIPLNVEMPVGFSTLKKGTSTYSIKALELINLSVDEQLILKDYQNPNHVVEKNLMDKSAYTFTSDSVITENRFSIMFKSSLAALNSLSSQNVSVYKNADHQISVQCTGTTFNIVTVYSDLGQKLAEKRLTGNATVIETFLPSGIYLVTVSNSEGKVTKKVIIN